MPTYTYKCIETGEEFDYFQSMNDKPLEFIPEGIAGYDPNNPKKVRRKVSGGAGMIFKGSGYYLTDYGKAGAKSESKSETSSTSN